MPIAISKRCRFSPFAPSIALLVAALIGLAGQESQARQARMPGNVEVALQADFTRRDMVFFQQDLRLDDGQQAVLTSLFADYEKAFQAGSDALRAELAAIMPKAHDEDPAIQRRRDELRQQIEALTAAWEKAKTNDPEVRRGLREKTEAIRQELITLQSAGPSREEISAMYAAAAAKVAGWQAEKARLHEAFITDVQAMLNDEQQLLWPPLDRRLVREHTIARGRLSGESVDLFAILREMNVDPGTRDLAAEPLGEYDIRLDAALRARNTYLDSTEQDLLAAVEAADIAKVSSIIDRQMQLRIAVRSANDDSIPAVAARLPSEVGARFTQAALAKGFPRVFRSTQAQRMMSAAKEINGLAGDVLKAVNELEQAYLVELKAANDQIIQSTRDWEPEDLKNRSKQQVAAKAGQAAEGAEDPVHQHYAARASMGQRYIQQLKALLTPEQFAALPSGSGRAVPDRDDGRPEAAAPDDILRRFDLDGDGVLNEQEREAVRQFGRSQRAPEPPTPLVPPTATAPSATP